MGTTRRSINRARTHDSEVEENGRSAEGHGAGRSPLGAADLLADWLLPRTILRQVAPPRLWAVVRDPLRGKGGCVLRAS
jgi:hypothetical protein